MGLLKNTSYYVKSKLEKIKNGLDEVKFLMSESYRLFLQKVVHGVTGRYDIKVIFSNGVFTDNKIISVNPVHPYVMIIKDLAGKTLVILGQLAHEAFHCIYTDFETLKVLESRHKSKGEFRMKQVHESMNIIEDAAIELAGTNYYTGSFKQAIIANNQNALDNMPSLDDLAVKLAPRLSIFKQACAMYCILGTMKGKLYDPELISLFKLAMPILDKGRLAPTSWGRLDAAEELYYLMLPLIEEVETQRKQQESENNYKYTKNGKISSGGQGSSPEEQPEIEQDFQKKNKKETKEDVEKQEVQTKKQPIPQGLEFEIKAGGKEGTTSGDENSSEKEDTEEDNASNDSESGSGGGQSGESEKEEERPDDSDADDEAETEKEKEDLEEMLKNLGEQLDNVKEDAAKEEYDKAEQQKADKAIREFGKSVSYASLHRHIIVESKRDFRVDDGVKNHYNIEYELIKSLTRNLTKNLLDVIKFNEDQRTTGLFNGKVTKSQLFRADKKIFCQRKDKSDEADLAILMLIDQSGSMGGDRIRYALLAAMMLYEVCEALEIPFAVIGHCAESGGRRVYHRHFIDFDSRDKNEKYKLAGMDVYDNTREGVSLKYAGEYLKQRPETDKILLSISDGRPYHHSVSDTYCDDIAQKDTGRVVKQLESDGVKTFGVAIGDGKSEIKSIYTHNYIDIPSINLLPTRLIGLVQRNLFK